jgi:hypothetical protein
MKIQGIWKGYYEYGIGYRYPVFGKRVAFTIRFEEENDSFTGKSKEEESNFSVPYEAEVRGYVEETFVSMVKTYPVNPVLTEDFKKIEFKEGELEVEHEGFLDHKNNAMYGLWRIETIYIYPETGQQFDGVVEGTWFLEKTEEN